MNAAVFLDRDGTIVEDVGIIREPQQLSFLPGAVEALRFLGRKFRLFIVTNQAGIAGGVLTHDQLRDVHVRLTADLRRHGVEIERVFYCPHARTDDCECIKPKPHFLEVARRECGIDLAASWAIGDHPHDVEFAARGGARGVYVLTGHGRKHLPELAPGNLVATDLRDAARIILGRVEETRVDIKRSNEPRYGEPPVCPSSGRREASPRTE